MGEWYFNFTIPSMEDPCGIKNTKKKPHKHCIEWLPSPAKNCHRFSAHWH